MSCEQGQITDFWSPHEDGEQVTASHRGSAGNRGDMPGVAQVVKALKFSLEALETTHPGKCLSWFVIAHDDLGRGGISHQPLYPLCIDTGIPGLPHKQDIRGAVYPIKLLPRDPSKALIV